MFLTRLTILLLLAHVMPVVLAQGPESMPHPRKILRLMGAKIENSASPETLASYEAIFKRLDANADGWLTAKEFVEEGNYLSEQVRRAIFRVSDSDDDETVSQAEYVLNRVITDEAKTILQNMDRDKRDGVTEDEFMAGCSIEDKEVAAQVFHRFDADGDGMLVVPEFLRVWGQWARTAPVTAKLVVRQESYVLPAERRGEAFRKRIREEEQLDELPEVPAVKLVLVIHNTSDEPVIVWPRGGVDEPELTVTGPGMVEPESLRGGSGSSSATTPQPVILPGKKFRVPIKSLNPGGSSFGIVYWSEPGEYQISATYPIWKNLPPHLPALFPQQPKPKGPAIQFTVKTPPVTVKVVAE